MRGTATPSAPITRLCSSTSIPSPSASARSRPAPARLARTGLPATTPPCAGPVVTITVSTLNDSNVSGGANRGCSVTAILPASRATRRSDAGSTRNEPSARFAATACSTCGAAR
jgi:hypothetical protein